MLLEAVETQRLYQLVARQLEDMIRDGKIERGARLPSERDLSIQLKVSRPTVREAMIALEVAGLIEINPGSGIYVRQDLSPADLQAAHWKTETQAAPGPFEVLSARLLIEPQVAGEAATHASDDDLAALHASVQGMRGVTDYITGLENDRYFHFLVARASQNMMLARTVEELWTHMFSPIFTAMSSYTGLSDTREMDVRDHSEIVAQIEARSAGGARKAMRRHLLNVKRILLKN